MDRRTRLTALLLAGTLGLAGAACDDSDDPDVVADGGATDATDATDDVDGGDATDDTAATDADADADTAGDGDSDGDTDGATDSDGEGGLATAGTLTVADQETGGALVTVSVATLEDGPGFVVVRADVDGAPGPVLGVAYIEAGENLEVEVVLDQSFEGELDLWAVLHVDADGDRELDFPDGDDVPLEVDDEVVQEQFTATST